MNPDISRARQTRPSLSLRSNIWIDIADEDFPLLLHRMIRTGGKFLRRLYQLSNFFFNIRILSPTSSNILWKQPVSELHYVIFHKARYFFSVVLLCIFERIPDNFSEPGRLINFKPCITSFVCLYSIPNKVFFVFSYNYHVHWRGAWFERTGDKIHRVLRSHTFQKFFLQ